MDEHAGEYSSNNKERIRVVTFLCREQVDYLDHTGKDALFLSGKKLSRAQLLATLVDMLIKSGIHVEKLNLKNIDIAGQLLKAIQDNHNGKDHEDAI